MKSAIQDDCFKVHTPEAELAMSTAKSLLVWGLQTSSSSTLHKYAEELDGALHSCIQEPPTSKSRREKMWSRFNCYITSADYPGVWNGVTSDSGTASSPVLFFYITYSLFTTLMKTTFPVTTSSSPVDSQPLSNNEENALNYVGG